MKIAIYSREELLHQPEELTHLIGVLESYGMSYYVNAPFASVISEKAGITVPADRIYNGPSDFPSDAGMMISYGGDGTFLDSVRLLDNRPIPILGINSGRLGFLANVSKDNIKEALKEVASGNYSVEERSMVSVEGDFEKDPEFPCAFNEFSVQKNGVTMVSVEIYVDGEYITSYLGDGMILSTPAGSTAYSLSVGGPIVAPQCKCFVLAPIASHNLTMRPIVIPDSSIVEFRVHTRGGKSIATLDNTYFDAPDGASFRISLAKNPIFFVKLQNISFYKTLREKMMWGVDSREFVK